MTADQYWVLTVLLGALVLLVTEWLPAGITGLTVMAALCLGDVVIDGGVVPAESVFRGLTNKAVLAVAAMFAISAGIARTGAVGLFANVVMDRPGSEPKKIYVGVLLVVMVASAFMNNTPLVLIFLPVVLGLSDRMDRAPSKMLIPLSFISIMGGMCTLIGTSTNIIVATELSEISNGEYELTMFDFAPMGGILAIAGATFLLLFGQRFLPSRPSLGLSLQGLGATEYMTELEIFESSDFVGKTVDEAFPAGKSVRVLQLIRNDVIRPVVKGMKIQPHDLLLVKGEPAAIMAFYGRTDTGVIPAINLDEARGATTKTQPKSVEVTLAEVVLTPGSRWLDRRVRDVKFRERYGVSVFAVLRHGAHLREKVDELRLKTGDILLVQGSVNDLSNLKASDNLLVIEGVQRGIPQRNRAPVALGAITVFIVMASMFPHMVHIAALTAGLIMVIGRCLSAGEAYAAMDWDVLFLLAGTIALGGAFADTGLSAMAANGIVDVCGPMGATVTVGALFLFTTLITQILSNNAAAAMMTPLAYELGRTFPGDLGPMPFVMAVAFGASCCFLTPIGYGTNLLIYGPGGYKFTDFLKIGLPLTIIFVVLATFLLPIVYAA